MAESLADVTLPTAGTYYARITGGDDTIQLYELSLTVVTLLPGDFNFDGDVDAADYVVWRKTDGTQAEYDTWRTHFGEMSVRRAGANATVPEPATLVMLIVAAVGGSPAASPYCKRVPKTQFRVIHTGNPPI